MQGLLETVTHYATAVGLRINTLQTTVMATLIPGEQRQAVPLDIEPLEDVDKLNYFVANGQGTEEIRNRINLARSAFSHLQPCLWSRVLLYGCETWPVPVSDERMLEVFDNDCIRRILHLRRIGCVPSVEWRRNLCLTSTPAQLVQRRLRWFGHAERRPDGELVKHPLLLETPRTWCRGTGGQPKTWTATVKADLESLF